MSKLIKPSQGSSGAIPPKPPAKSLSEPSVKIEPKLEIISLNPPSSDLKVSNQEFSDLADALNPIPAPSSTLQYRAIGVIFGQYISSAEHFCKGKLITTDGTEIEAVVLGRVMPILQKKLDLEKNYLWVVYPRTIEKTSKLYVQISGVWAPRETGKTDFDLDANLEDGYFSIRGEVLEQSLSRNHVIVKIRRIDKDKKLPQARTKFKLKLKGILPSNAVGYFWDIKAQRQEHRLVITSAKAIALIPKKAPKKPVKKNDAITVNPLTQDRPKPNIKRPKI